MRKTYITIFLATAFTLARGQAGITNNGKLYIHSGANLTSFINMDNKSGAELLNNGSLHSKADLRNDQALMVSGTGTLYLDGSSAQQVNGSAGMITYNLVTNNTAGITLNNNLSVAGAHTYSNGMIGTSGSANFLIYEAGSTYSGATDSRHVNGRVKKIGSTDFIFPVGNNTWLRSVAIGNLSASSEFNCYYSPNTANIFNLWSPLVQVRANEFWQLDKISGGTAKVTLNWDHSKVAMDNVMVTDILAAQYYSSNWHAAGGTASGTVTTTGTIQSDALNSFGPMTLGYKSFPVPLKLISFEGERRDTVNLLHWISDNEYNVDRFEIQRSTDAINYMAIGYVSGRNSGQRELYQFTDPSAYGIHYYRLRMIDNDGSYTYSRVIAINTGMDGSGILVKSPAKNVITIFNKSRIAGAFNYELLNEGGQQLLKGILNMTSNGTGVINLPLQISTGVYYLNLYNNGVRTSLEVFISQ